MEKVVCNLSFIILICSFLPHIISADNGKGTTVGEFLNKQIEVIDNATSEVIEHDIINLRRPPSSIICNQTNTDKIKIFKNAEGFLYMLSVNELLAIDVNSKKEATQHFVGTLLQFDEPALEFQIENWENMIVIVLKMAKSLHVYLTKNDFKAPRNLEPIQRIKTISAADRFVLFKNGDELLLVTYEIKTEASNELIFYKWKTSFFSKESSESIDLPNKSKMFVFNEHTKEPLILSIGLGNTARVVIMKLNLETNRWMKLQSMHFKQDYIEHYVIDGSLYLIGCSTDAFCAIYKWNDSQFRRHIKINSLIFERIKSVYYKHDIVIMENSENMLALYTSDDIAATQPGIILPKTNNLTEFAIFKSPIDQKLFFVEFNFNKSSMAINFYDLSIIKSRKAGEERESSALNPVLLVAKLKAFLKSRIPKVQSSHQNAQKIGSQENKLQMENKKIIRMKRASLEASKVNNVKMPYTLKTTAKNLQKMATDSNIQVELTRRASKRSEMPSTKMRADEDPNNFEEMDNIVVQNLVYNGKMPIFTDLLLKSVPIMILDEDIKLRNISANKLVVSSNLINRIPLPQLLNATTTKQVKGTKRFQRLKVANLEVSETLNNIPLAFLDPSTREKPFELAEGFEFIEDINVKHLRVKSINGFSVPAIIENVFLKGERSTINGTLVIQNVTNVNQLVAKSLMEVPVESFLTKSTNQTILADLSINTFFVSELTTNTINDEKFSQNVALTNDVNIIDVPTQFMTIHILKNLNIKDANSEHGEARDAITETIESLKRHVIGTKTADLSQIYNGKVLIRGSLTIEDAKCFSPKTRIFVGDREVSQNITANYWMKSLKQDIKVEKFTVNNQALTASNAITRFLNGHPIKDYLMLDSKVAQGPVNIRFEKAVVEGDVKGHQDNIPSIIYYLSQNSVQRDGPPVLIQSSVNFREKLAIRNLATAFINQGAVNELVHVNQPQIVFVGPKTLKMLKVNQLNVDGVLNVENFNNVSLKDFAANAIRIDRPIEINSLKIETFKASTLTTQFFEDHLFNEFIESLEKEFESKDDGITRRAKTMRVFGNADFQSNVFVDTINEKTEFNDFVNLLVLKNEPSEGIGGDKIFKQSLTVIDDLQTSFVNDFPMDRLLYQSLARGERQTITGTVHVKTLKTKSLRSKVINDIMWNQLIDKKKVHLPLKVNLYVNELEVRNMESQSSSYDINKMLELIQFPQRTKWNTITVDKAAEVPLDKSSYLDRVMASAVTRVGAPQVITGRVQVENSKFFFKKLFKPDGIIVAKETFIDLHALFVDSVKNYTKGGQVVGGIKSFLAPIYVGNVKSMSPYFMSKEINGINIKNLNDTIVRPVNIIDKKKTFEHLLVEEVELKGMINGIKPETIIFITNNAVVLPRLNINHLEVIALKTFMFNEMSLSYFLHNRMRKFAGPEQEFKGLFSAAHLDLSNDTVLSSINGVFIDDAVFSQSDQLQDITGFKTVVGNITLVGISVINNINNVDFNNFIKNSVVRHQNYAFDYLELPAVELKQGLVAKQSINGHRIGELLSSDAHIPKLVDLISLMSKVQAQIEELNRARKVRSSKPKRLLYVDYDPDVNIVYDGARAVAQRCADHTIEPSQYNTIRVRQKRGSEMNIQVPSASFTVKPNFQCRENVVTSKTLSVWWNLVGNPNDTFFRNFAFPTDVADVSFMETNKGVILMILTMQNLTSRVSHIGILRLDKGENDWYEHQPNIVGLNFMTKAAVVDTPENQFLVISSYNEATPSDSDYVLIYRFEPHEDKFVEHQRRLSGDKFDIILGITVPPKNLRMKSSTFLLLAHERSKFLYIYRTKELSKDFVFQRKIPFESEINEVIVVFINNDAPYFIVSLQSGEFCIFEWRGIESWKAKQCGHFANIDRVQTYEYLKRQHLFLTSTLNAGTAALTVHRQGDFF